MSGRWYNLAVILFWLASMSWLVVEKVLPPLLVGNPPDYGAILAQERQEPSPPVSWHLYWHERPVGWSVSQTRLEPDGQASLESRLHISRFPLKELAPVWLAPMLEGMLGPSGELDVDAESQVLLVPLGSGGDYRLDSFRSQVHLGPLKDAIRLRGLVEGSRLSLVARCGEFVYRTQTELARDALVGDALSPRNRLPDLRQGQSWTEPVYSPFRAPHSPMQVLQAVVQRREPIAWNGEIVDAWLIVYRNDPGSERSRTEQTVGRAWVRSDGTVLKQELRVLGSTLLFVRLPPEHPPPAELDLLFEDP